MNLLSSITSWLLGTDHSSIDSPSSPRLRPHHDSSVYTEPKDHVFSWPHPHSSLGTSFNPGEGETTTVPTPDLFEFPLMPLHLIDATSSTRKRALSFAQEVMDAAVSLRQEGIKRVQDLDKELANEIKDLTKRQDKAIKKLRHISTAIDDSEEKVNLKFHHLRLEIAREILHRKREVWVDYISTLKTVGRIQLNERHVMSCNAYMVKCADEKKKLRKDLEQFRKSEKKVVRKSVKRETRKQSGNQKRLTLRRRKSDFEDAAKKHEEQKTNEMQQRHEKVLGEILKDTEKWAKRLNTYYDEQLATYSPRAK